MFLQVFFVVPAPSTALTPSTCKELLLQVSTPQLVYGKNLYGRHLNLKTVCVVRDVGSMH